MRKSTRGLMLLSSIVAGALVLAGCSASTPSSTTTGSNKPVATTDFPFQLNFTPGGFNAGFEYAAEHGLYKDAGLNVTITPGTGSGVTAQLVASGQASVAYADGVTVSALIAKGAPMKTIMTIYQSNPNEVTTLTSSGIKSIKDLKGHTVGVPTGGSQTAMLPILLAKNGLKDSDIQQVGLPGTSLVQALLQKQVDAILGSSDAYGVQLDAQGAKTRNWTFADNGVSTVSTSVFANSTYLVDHPTEVKAFIKASLAGWAAVIADPKEGAAAVKAYFPSSNESQSLAELTAISGLFCAGGAQYVGKAPAESWSRTQSLLSGVGLLPAGIDASKYYTYNYLPKDSELQKCSNGKVVPLAKN